MAYLNISNVAIRGIAACVPTEIEENLGHPSIKEEDALKLIQSTGIARHHKSNQHTTTSDLGVAAANVLIDKLGWERSTINFLVFVSQTFDYTLPASACLVAHRLELSEECFAIDIQLGCSGWIYGLSTISALMANTQCKGLLIAGDTITKICSTADKSTFPLFGDACTCTALESGKTDENFLFHFGSDGSGASAIIVEDGGFRNQVSPESFITQNIEEGISRNKLQLTLDGMDVFSFGINKAPQSVEALIQNFNLNKEDIDCFTFHQANLFMNEKIRKKLKLPIEKVPYSLQNFGNTSSASIPLTLVTERSSALQNTQLNHIACGFGVGLSWGSIYFTTNCIVCPPLIVI